MIELATNDYTAAAELHIPWTSLDNKLIKAINPVLPLILKKNSQTISLSYFLCTQVVLYIGLISWSEQIAVGRNGTKWFTAAALRYRRDLLKEFKNH